jgi:hypothetical protein
LERRRERVDMAGKRRASKERREREHKGRKTKEDWKYIRRAGEDAWIYNTIVRETRKKVICLV